MPDSTQFMPQENPDRSIALANRFDNVDGYIASRKADVQTVTEELRQTLRNALPGYGEKVSYQMPTVTVNGKPLMYFAAWKHHIGLYPIPTLDEPLEEEISAYRAAKDTVRLPLSKPIPYDLVARLAEALLNKRSDQPN
jgi:uncharacterized protein YdhG (YjbR/CyaY superfamily)